jgi:DNA repair protein RecO (recombination protein O)
MKRIAHEPAFVLHRYDWSESSLILEVFTRHHGRIALVAKGAKRPSSNFRPVLLPLQPLNISYSGDAEVGTLKGAEWTGGQTMPSGEALLSGYYLNELVMRLLARDDPHEALFDAYVGAVQLLCERDALDAALRSFELVLLREIGLLPLLSSASLTMQDVTDDVAYTLVSDAGLLESNNPHGESGDKNSRHNHAHLTGAAWRTLQTALDDAAPFHATRMACAALPAAQKNALKMQLRALLHAHCASGTLRTRQLMMDLQNL